LVRVLRAAGWCETCGGVLDDYLDVGDARTTGRLLTRLGLGDFDNVSVLEYLSNQRLIRDPALIEELKKLVTEVAATDHDDWPHH
jgi:hypothetical protein